MPPTSKKAQEIWEATTGGTTYLHVKDPRNPEGWVQKKVGGKGTKRITLTVEEREFNQELVPYEKQHVDPFTNGLLVRISPKDVKKGEKEKTDAELVAIFGLDDDGFAEALRSPLFESEIIARRLFALAEKHATMVRYKAIEALIDDRWSIGKTSKVVAEMENDDSRYAAADL